MAGFIVRKRDPLLFVTVLVVLLCILASQVENESGSTLLTRTVMGVCSPFVRVSAWTAQRVRDTWFGYFNLVDARAANRRTRSEFDKQALELALLREKLRTYERSEVLHQFLEGLDLPGAEALLQSIRSARVISNHHWDERSRILLLNRGASSGFKKNMPVITSEGVVGKTVTCTEWVSTVLLATDVNSGISSRVARSRVWGMLTGGGSLADGRPALEMQHISSLDDVDEGDLVVTSGLGGIYPAGLPVGTVISVEDGPGLSKRVQVEPAVRMSLLEEVLVLSKEEQLPWQLAGDTDPDSTAGEPESETEGGGQ